MPALRFMSRPFTMVVLTAVAVASVGASREARGQAAHPAETPPAAAAEARAEELDASAMDTMDEGTVRAELERLEARRAELEAEVRALREKDRVDGEEAHRRYDGRIDLGTGWALFALSWALAALASWPDRNR
jgi:hypothetical protein